jgi:small-conductance mechanosensitive channel
MRAAIQQEQVVRHLPLPVQLVLDRILAILGSQTELTESFVGIAGVVVGSLFLLAYALPSFNFPLIFDTNPAYSAMREVAPQWVWGTLYLSIGLFVVGFLLLEHYQGRMLATFAATFPWIYLAVMIARSTGIANPGVGIYSLIAVYTVLSFWRNCARPRASRT